MQIKFDAKTEKVIETAAGIRIEGEEEIGKGKNAHIYRWVRYISHNEIKDKKPESSDN